jgi:anti-sigma regulatory factor (Ser/Thr protein kinase)
MPEIPLVPSLWRFPAHSASVRRARHAVAEALPCGLSPQLTVDLGLLTSELVTNAIRHGSRPEDNDPVELVLWPADGHYWLAVSDPGTGTGTGIGRRTHIAACPDMDSETGRGLILVDSISTAWTIRPSPARGTSVIAGLALHHS